MLKQFTSTLLKRNPQNNPTILLKTLSQTKNNSNIHYKYNNQYLYNNQKSSLINNTLFAFCSQNNQNNNNSEQQQKLSTEEQEDLFHDQLKRFTEDLESGKLTQETLEQGSYRPTDFSTIEQQISFELLNTSGLEDIVKVYNQYKDNEQAFNGDLYTLFLHFMANLKIDLTHSVEFKEILQKSLKSIQDLSPDHLRILVWTLGNYIAHFEQNSQYEQSSSEQKILEIPELYKLQLADQIQVKYERFGYNYAIPICYACVNIFTSEKDFVLLHQIVKKFAFLLSQNTMQLTVSEVVQFIMLFEKVQLDDINIIEPFIERLSQVIEDLNGPQLAQVVQVLSFIKYQKNEQIVENFYQQLHENMEDLSLDNACQVVFSMPNIYRNNEEMLQNFLDFIANNCKKINITQYINLWLTLAKLRVDLQEYNRFLKVLIKSIEINEVFTVKELQNDEIISIIAACSALKINQKEFIQKFIDIIEVKYLQKHELFALALSFIVYVRQFTPFYTEIHQQCCFMYPNFNEQERQALAKTFQRVKTVLPPNSPYL